MVSGRKVWFWRTRIEWGDNVSIGYLFSILCSFCTVRMSCNLLKHYDCGLGLDVVSLRDGEGFASPHKSRVLEADRDLNGL